MNSTEDDRKDAASRANVEPSPHQEVMLVVSRRVMRDEGTHGGVKKRDGWRKPLSMKAEIIHVSKEDFYWKWIVLTSCDASL